MNAMDPEEFVVAERIALGITQGASKVLSAEAERGALPDFLIGAIGVAALIRTAAVIAAYLGMDKQRFAECAGEIFEARDMVDKVPSSRLN